MRTFSSLFLLFILAGIALADEPSSSKPTPKSPDEIVKAGILQFNERMRSDDQKVRDAEFDAVMPAKATLEKLFGDDANLIWPRLSERMKQIRANSDKSKEEFDRQGKIVAVELFDVRKDDVSRRYRRVFEIIPKDIPVFRAVIKYEKGTGGSSSYVVIDGKMRFVQGLETIAELIDAQKKSQK